VENKYLAARLNLKSRALCTATLKKLLNVEWASSIVLTLLGFKCTSGIAPMIRLETV